MAGKLGANPTLQPNCDVSRSFITDRKGRNDDDLSQGAAFCTYLFLSCGSIAQRAILGWGGVFMEYTDEELEYYLELWQKEEGPTITVKKDLLVALAKEVLINSGQFFEELDTRKLVETSTAGYI